MRARTLVYYDGHCLSDYCRITNLSRPRPNRKPSVSTIPGMDGETITDVRLLPIEITMQLNFTQDTPDERMTVRDMIEGWLFSREPKPLVFSDQTGYYMAIQTTRGAPKRRFTSDSEVSVKFRCPDPVRYGEQRSITIPSGQTAQIEICGTYQTSLVVESTNAKRDAQTRLWGVSVDDSTFTEVELSDSSTHSVVFDVSRDRRASLVDGVSKLITLDSDWADTIEPGMHEVGLSHGTGAITVSWVERWL